MSLSRALLAEFDYEMVSTRKTLERLPSGKKDWRPHPKSMTLGRLAGHLAEIPGWVIPTIRQDSLDLAPPGQPPYEAVVADSAQAALELFDKNVAAAREALAVADDSKMMDTWTLLVGGRTVLSMPRASVLRGFVMNHLIHHRAQLGVYLRLNDIPVPSTYGPSADEGQMG